ATTTASSAVRSRKQGSRWTRAESIGVVIVPFSRVRIAFVVTALMRSARPDRINAVTTSGWSRPASFMGGCCRGFSYAAQHRGLGDPAQGHHEGSQAPAEAALPDQVADRAVARRHDLLEAL